MQVASAVESWQSNSAWMDGYHTTMGGVHEPPQPGCGSAADDVQAAADYYKTLQVAASAAAAAGASNSGLSCFLDPLAASRDGMTDLSMGEKTHPHQDMLSQQQHTTSSVRAALLEQHGLTLEQFASLEDALEALAECDQQQAVVGLAEEDYSSGWEV